MGRASHLGQVACEANAVLAPMYIMQEAKMTVRAKDGSKRRVKPRRLVVAGNGATQREYQNSLAWLDAAMEAGVTAPLAPRVHFPAI